MPRTEKSLSAPRKSIFAGTMHTLTWFWRPRAAKRQAVFWSKLGNSTRLFLNEVTYHFVRRSSAIQFRYFWVNH